MTCAHPTYVAAIASALLALSPSSAARAAESGAGRPNVIVVALDDVGYSDLGCFGAEIKTPNIDRLAQRGLRYNNFDTMAICSPTRASLLTGRNCQTVRMGDLPSNLPRPDPADVSNRKGELPDNAQMMSQVLQRAGYSTFAIGKWHLSPAYETGAPGSNASFPLQRGFDYFYGFKMGWTDQYHPELYEGNNRIPTPTRPNYHLSEDLVEHAISAMRASREKAPDKPLFLYLALGVAHAPVQVPKDYIDRYDAVYRRGWDAIREERFARMKQMGLIPQNTVLPGRNEGDPSWTSLTDQQRKVYARFMAAYAGFLEHGDAQLGKLLAYLDESHLADNTIIVLFSDNGAASESKTGAFRRPYLDQTTLDEMEAHLDELGTDKTQPLYQRPWAMAGVTPLRRYKLWPFLGGVRTPLIVSFPGAMKDQGAIRNQYVDVIDLAPTLLEAVGCRFEAVVDGKPQLPVAGVSFLKTLSAPAAPSAHTVQFFELRGNRALRSGNWRAVAMHKPGTDFAADQWLLFDLANDPAESMDVAKRFPERVKELEKLWWAEAQKHGDLPLTEPAPLVLRFSGFEDGLMKD